ncbi:MAG TPA: pyridoxamine 5'-phosphate oxidase family protein [Solirubrobacteraceae bacterium]|jgi:PPOX class probable F420-dependent enzyme
MPRSTFSPRERELLKDRNFCHVSVTRPDATIQSVVVWCDLDDDDRVVLNSAEGRAWPENLRRSGHATVTVMNHDNPLEYVTVLGRLAEDTNEGADDVINALSHKYDGGDYAFEPGQQRVTFRLEPERITHRG